MNTKKIYLIFCFFITFLFVAGQQVITSSQNGKTITIATIGLGNDDESIISFFKKYPVWSKAINYGGSPINISIEFIGFEKENNSSKPFQYGKDEQITVTNPIKGAVFIHNDGYGFSKKLFFRDYGEVLWSIGNSNETVKGSYSYNENENSVNVSMPNAKSQFFKLQKSEGKNLGITGEAIENMWLVDISTGEKYTKQSNSESAPKKIEKHWAFPENRFLIKYKITHDRYMIDVNQGRRIVTKKNQTEEKYAFIKNFVVLERDAPSANYDILADTKFKWKTIELSIVSEVDRKEFVPGISPEALLNSEYSLIGIKLYREGGDWYKGNTDNPEKYQLYVNSELNEAGWTNKDGAISNSTYSLPQNLFLSPARIERTSDGSISKNNDDSNCVMTFKPEVNPKEGVKLSNLITTNIYKLEVNSNLKYSNLSNKVYNSSQTTQKYLGFGKGSVKKATWFVDSNNNKIIFRIDNNEELTFSIVELRDGYIYKFKDSNGIVYILSDVQRK